MSPVDNLASANGAPRRASRLTGIVARLGGGGLTARAMRTSGFTAAGIATGQVLRLASNLVLTRLLFPEDFGLMALVVALTTGLALLSDVGLGPAIMQNPAGDEPRFLDTAWTIQIIRATILWLATCALALPVAGLYGEPTLALILPVAGLTLLISGFNPTRIETAGRHMRIGRVIGIDLLAQALAAFTTIVLALATRSVWALVVGMVAGAAIKLALAHLLLPGHRDRLGWDWGSARRLVHFGKWIVLSTACAFALSHADKLILAKLMPLDRLGLYAIASMIAQVPLLLLGAIAARVLVPLCRERPPAQSAGNRSATRRARMAITAVTMALLAIIAFVGVPLVEFLYDGPFVRAGALVVLIACAQLPAAVMTPYDQVAIAAGDTRGFFRYMAARSVAHIVGFVAGYVLFGLAGALAGQALAVVCVYPVLLRLAIRHGAQDVGTDVAFFAAGLLIAGLAIGVWHEPIASIGME